MRLRHALTLVVHVLPQVGDLVTKMCRTCNLTASGGAGLPPGGGGGAGGLIHLEPPSPNATCPWIKLEPQARLGWEYGSDVDASIGMQCMWGRGTNVDVGIGISVLKVGHHSAAGAS